MGDTAHLGHDDGGRTGGACGAQVGLAPRGVQAVAPDGQGLHAVLARLDGRAGLLAGALLAFAFVDLTGDDGVTAGTTPTAVARSPDPPPVGPRLAVPDGLDPALAEVGPDDVAVLVAMEICSITVQRDDVSMPNLVASGLFGDGAAAVVARGGTGRGGPAEVLASRSRLYPDSERTMGFDVTGGGLRIVLDAEVPAIVGRYIRGDVDGFLDDHGLTRADIGWWVCHPGGPKVIEALEEALSVPRDAVQLTWDSLARIGNLSSASVLHVLADTLNDRPPRPG